MTRPGFSSRLRAGPTEGGAWVASSIVTQPTPALDFSTFDTDVRVQDDLFRHVNGAWIEQTPIPDDKPLTGSFMVLRDDAEAAVRDIITGMDRSAAA